VIQTDSATDTVPDRRLFDTLRATLAETRLFIAFGQECIDNWPVDNVDLDRLDLWRTDARNALDALGGPIARTMDHRKLGAE
jgi:hypothetical protein